jgi:hypothetical protein
MMEMDKSLTKSELIHDAILFITGIALFIFFFFLPV